MFDLLPMLIAYLLVCTVLLTLYLLSDTKLLRNSPLKRSLIKLYKSGVRICPFAVRRAIGEAAQAVFYRRNTGFQCLFLGLMAFGHFVMLNDAIPIMYHWDYASNHVFIPLLLLFANLCMYACACFSDPGEITDRTLYKYRSVYGHDGMLFRDDSACDVCRFVRPARSRHCDACDVCIHRYDHHCVWTNSCIGGLNYRYFLGFLLSLCAVCANASWMAMRALAFIVASHRMWEAAWLDAENVQHPMTLRVLVQHLFVTYPRLVLLVFGPALVALPLIGYTGYHLYLASTNQTAYERRKLARLASSGGPISGGGGFGRGLRHNWRELLLPYERLAKDKVYSSAANAAAAAAAATRRRQQARDQQQY